MDEELKLKRNYLHIILSKKYPKLSAEEILEGIDKAICEFTEYEEKNLWDDWEYSINWLKRAAIFNLNEESRRKASLVSIDRSQPETDNTPPAWIDSIHKTSIDKIIEVDDFFYKAMDALPIDLLDIIFLRHFWSVSFKEIAEWRDSSLNLVWRKYWEAINILKVIFIEV